MAYMNLLIIPIEVLNDLLGGPANHVLDTETNQSANQQIQVQSTQNSEKGGRRKGKKIRNSVH